MVSSQVFHTQKCDSQTTFNLLCTQTKYTALEPESKTTLILIKYIKCLNMRDTGTEGKTFKNTGRFTKTKGSLHLILYCILKSTFVPKP